MNRSMIFCIGFALILSGCTPHSTHLKKPAPHVTGTNVMPEEMPDDFAFSVSYGFDKKNEVNTFTDTVTKDLIEDGTITAKIALTDEELSEIYGRMKEVSITGPKKLVPDAIDSSSCEQQPFEEDEWEIIIDGETITHAVSGKYCEPTDDAKHLQELLNFVLSKVKSKEVYRVLPEAVGGYD